MGVGLSISLFSAAESEAAPPQEVVAEAAADPAEAELAVEGPAGEGPAVEAPAVEGPAELEEVEPEPEPELGEVVEGPIERSVEIVALQIRGRKQVSAQQVIEALDAEHLLEGEQVFWPEDARINRAVQRLAATGYFDQVAIRLVPVSHRKDQASLVVDLHERGSLVVNEIHAANSELTPFAGGFNLMERNLAGTNVHLGAGFVVGTPARGVTDTRRQHAYEIYTELPAFAGTPIGAAASAYAILANEPYRVAGRDYDADPSNFDTVRYSRYGGVIGVTIPFTPDLRLGIDFRFEAIDARLPDAPTRLMPDGESRPIDLHLEDGLHYLSSAEFSFVWDERSRAAILGKGGHIRLDVQLSSPALGSSYEYLRVLIGGGYSFRLPWGHWLTPSLWGGQIAGDAPRFELILPGDLSDWTPGRTMGLQYSTRWPVDTFKTGVNAFALARLGGRVDLEYGIPLFRRPRTSFVYGGYLFFSAGVFTLTGSRSERTERRAAGELVAPIGLNANFGLKLDTNIGTFDISVGNILRRVPL